MRDDWFLAIESAPGDQPVVDEQRGRRPPSMALQKTFALAGGRRMTVLWSGATRVVETARRWIWITGPRPPDDALRRALESAESAAAVQTACTAPDGEAWSYFVVDKEAGDYSVIIDRFNLATVLTTRVGGQRLFGSNVALLSRRGPALDLGSAASYIVNGSSLNNRTIFRDIARLARASVHHFRNGGHAQEIYWRYMPGRTPRREPWQPVAATAQLWERVVESVDRATRGKRVLLALSGGYDSGVLLGILGARLRHPDVTCFSYAYGPQGPRSDAAVAAADAALHGYDHLAVSSYAGDLLRLLDASAALGQGLRGPAYEVDALAHLAERFAARPDTVMLFGDECFGQMSHPVGSPDGILGGAMMRSPALLDRLAPALGAHTTACLRAALEAEYDELRGKIRDFTDPDDAKDFLYLDQRLPFGLLPLRSLYAGNWFPVASPLISGDILDFIAAVPTAERIDKRLFRHMARRFLPEQFRRSRAVEGRFHPDFRKEIAGAHAALAAAIVGRGWAIEDCASNTALMDLLRHACAEVERRSWLGAGKAGLRKQLQTCAKALLASSPALEDRGHWGRRLLYDHFNTLPDPGYLYINVLSLADVLGGVATADPPRRSAPGAARPGLAAIVPGVTAITDFTIPLP
jgi:asparagine synthetase B (glutamine-hydrolysing)